MNESELASTHGNESPQMESPSTCEPTATVPAEEVTPEQRRLIAESYVADLMKLGVVPAHQMIGGDRLVFLNVLIEGNRVESFVRDGRCYISKVGPGKWDLHHKVPYRGATLMKTKVAPKGCDGRSEWWITKKGSRLIDGSGPMLLTDAGARTMSVMTGVPMADSECLKEMGRTKFFEASEALQALFEWCKAHPMLAKRNKLSAEEVLEGDFVI